MCYGTYSYRTNGCAFCIHGRLSFGTSSTSQVCVVRIHYILLVLILVNGPVDTKVCRAKYCSLMPCATLLYLQTRRKREHVHPLPTAHSVWVATGPHPLHSPPLRQLPPALYPLMCVPCRATPSMCTMVLEYCPQCHSSVLQFHLSSLEPLVSEEAW